MTTDEILRRYTAASERQSAGDTAAALAGYRSILELDPNHVHSLYNTAVIALQSRDLQQAAAQFRRAWVLDPTFAPAATNLVYTLRQLKREGEARSLVDGIRTATEKAIAKGDAESAIKLADLIQTLIGIDQGALWQKASALMMLERPADAIDTYSTLMANAPGTQLACLANIAAVEANMLGSVDRAYGVLQRLTVTAPPDSPFLISAAAQFYALLPAHAATQASDIADAARTIARGRTVATAPARVPGPTLKIGFLVNGAAGAAPVDALIQALPTAGAQAILVDCTALPADPASAAASVRAMALDALIVCLPGSDIVRADLLLHGPAPVRIAWNWQPMVTHAPWVDAAFYSVDTATPEAADPVPVAELPPIPPLHGPTPVPRADNADRTRFVLGGIAPAFHLGYAALDTWAQTVVACPNTHLIIANELCENVVYRSQTETRLKRAGLTAAQFGFRKVVSPEDRQAFAAEIDIALDAYPLPAPLRAVEMIGCGVPVIAAGWGAHRDARAAIPIYRTLGLTAWLASSAAEFPARVAAMCDRERLDRFRAEVSAQPFLPPGRDWAAFAKAFVARVAALVA